MTSHAQSSVGCAVCQRPVDPKTAVYNKNGDLICGACSATDQIVEGERRASASLVATAFGPLGLAGISLLFNMFFMLTLFSILGALAWLRASSQAPNFRGAKYFACIGVVVSGILLALHPLWLGTLRDALR